MNKIEYNQTGGFPLETDTLDFAQSAYSIFNALGHLAGDKAILTGCDVTGSNVSDGVVVINGEVLQFRGGLQSSTVVILEDTEERVFEDGASKVVFKTRYATFGSGTTSYAWSDFRRVTPLLEILKSLIPVGAIIKWSGSIENIPNFWYLCDGTNGTPDLTGKFVVGYDPNDADYNAIGKTGGEKEVTLTEAQMPQHNHSGSVYIPPHQHDIRVKKGVMGSSNDDNAGGSGRSSRRTMDDATDFNAKTEIAGGVNASITTGNKGGGQAHENRPPYYTLAYIMFKGE